MELTQKQKRTIGNIKGLGIVKPLDVIGYCIKKLDQPHKISYTSHPNAPHVPRRHHSKKHYQEIIDYLAQGNESRRGYSRKRV